MRKLRRIGSTILFILLAIAAIILLLAMGTGVLNADLYGRLTETRWIGIKESNRPSLLIIVHRLLPDENSAEASVVLSIETGISLADSVESGKVRLRASVYDASGNSRFVPLAVVTLDSVGWRSNTGEQGVASSRFNIPVEPSVSGFPFDDVQVELLAVLESADGIGVDQNLGVQKAVPGRLVHVTGNSMHPVIQLVRSPTEQVVVLASSAVFLLLSVILTSHLFRRDQRLSALEEVLTVAGFLVGTAGFREIVGVSRSSGMSALEVLVFGVPILSISAGMLVSMYRARRGQEPDGHS